MLKKSPMKNTILIILLGNNIRKGMLMQMIFVQFAVLLLLVSCGSNHKDADTVQALSQTRYTVSAIGCLHLLSSYI